MYVYLVSLSVLGRTLSPRAQRRTRHEGTPVPVAICASSTDATRDGAITRHEKRTVTEGVGLPCVSLSERKVSAALHRLPGALEAVRDRALRHRHLRAYGVQRLQPLQQVGDLRRLQS